MERGYGARAGCLRSIKLRTEPLRSINFNSRSCLILIHSLQFHPMHIGINALILRRGEYSGVHVSVRGMMRAVVDACAPDDRFTLYVQRKTPDGLPGATKFSEASRDGHDGSGGEPDARNRSADRVKHLKPFWPVGWRAGRITYEQFVLHQRVFSDKIDLLHCPAYVMPHWCLKPVVLTVHDVFALRNPELCTKANRTHFRRMMPKSLARARRIVVPSQWVRDEILAWAREVREQGEDGRKFLARSDLLEEPELVRKIQVIPWGVDARFRPVQDANQREEIALRHGLPPKYVLYVGRMEPKKNVRRVVEAYFAATASAGLPHRLVMAGPRGWGVDGKIRRMIIGLGLESKVVLPGFVPDRDLPAIYSMASCLLFPSRAEGFGLPVLEAMACGAPVVCADIPPLRELAGDAGILVGPDDLPGMRTALEKVLGQDEVARELTGKGLVRARKFSWQAHAQQTLSMYQAVILEDQRSRFRSE